MYFDDDVKKVSCLRCAMPRHGMRDKRTKRGWKIFIKIIFCCDEQFIYNSATLRDAVCYCVVMNT